MTMVRQPQEQPGRGDAAAPVRERTPAGGSSDPDRSPAPGTMPPRRTWLSFLFILLVNFLVVRLLFPGGETTVKVPYTLFKEEVTKGNVERIYSRGVSLTGRFDTPVTYTPFSADTASRAEPRAVTAFATTLPAFVDPGLEALLIA